MFTLTATLSLAMGIGANAAVFTVIERVLLRPLPVSNPQELVYVTDQRILEEQSPRFSYPFYEALRDNTVLSGAAARYGLAVNATMNGQDARVSGELVSGNYFTVVGTGTQIGRTLTAEDDRTPGAHAVAVISDGVWRRSFGSDPSVLASFGQTRQAAVLTGVFGILALRLSGIGVYGVTALAVTRRTRDIGIQIALGAEPRHIVRAIGQRGLTLVIAGFSLGLLGSFGFTQLAGSLLYGVTARDSVTFAGVSALLAVVSLIAFSISVRSATRLDAVTAIRYE